MSFLKSSVEKQKENAMLFTKALPTNNRATQEGGFGELGIMGKFGEKEKQKLRSRNKKGIC